LTTNNNLCSTKLTLSQQEKKISTTHLQQLSNNQTYNKKFLCNKSSNARRLQLDVAFYIQSKEPDGTLPYSKDLAGATKEEPSSLVPPVHSFREDVVKITPLSCHVFFLSHFLKINIFSTRERLSNLGEARLIGWSHIGWHHQVTHLRELVILCIVVSSWRREVD